MSVCRSVSFFLYLHLALFFSIFSINEYHESDETISIFKRIPLSPPTNSHRFNFNTEFSLNEQQKSSP